MSMYGDSNVKVKDLKEWAAQLSIEQINKVNIAGECYELTVMDRELLQLQIDLFKKYVAALSEGDDWRRVQHSVSKIFNHIFFKVSDNAIKIANYYECLLISGNVYTKKKIIKGFDYTEVGEISIYEDDKLIGCIGMKSDLLWSVLIDYFIYESDIGEIIHTCQNHEEYLSIQLTNINGLSLSQIEHKVRQILLECSNEFGLDFKVVKLSKELNIVGEDGVYRLDLQNNYYENEPLIYFNNGIATEDIRMKYLSYYQVLEYFFNRVQNYKLLDEIKQGNYLESNNINHKNLKKILKKYVNKLSERESLKLVISRGVNIQNIKDWINRDIARIEQYTNWTEPRVNIDILKSDDKIIDKLAERFYYFRCAIAHAKGDTDEYLAIPEQSNEIICNEIDLIKLVAEQVMLNCSE
ncbi:hypothetical protein LAD12857_49660 [Lacrimispora amygdalina]|uniref:Apea-like HEPN domain-containing protein n=1 Tax=Lacrimispora amygdalina TaxID=253257 RepID=A0ABQ5MDY3_9FIRM